MIEIKNAVIENTMLGYEDHGILTCLLTLNYGGSCQCFGGYALDGPVKIEGKFSHREGSAFGMNFIKKILDTLGVSSWEKLNGTNVRVRSEHTKVHAIGHLLKDDWFDPSELKTAR